MRLKDDLILRHIGNDYIIVEPGQDQIDLSKVYTLNETAAWLWEELKGRDFSLTDVVDALLDQYEVDRETAEADAKTLLELFREQKLLVF